MGVGREPLVGLSKYLSTNRSVVQSVSDPDWHNSRGRPGLPLKSVWHPMKSY